MTTFTEEIEMLATDWFRRCRESQTMHYEYASKLQKRHLWVGGFSIALSAIVGTAVFSAWESSVDSNWIRVIFGMLSVVAASAAALQTFLNLSDKASEHKLAGASYGALRRELELLKTLPPIDQEAMQNSLNSAKIRMNELAEKSPGVPSKFKKLVDRSLQTKDYKGIYQIERIIDPNTLGLKNLWNKWFNKKSYR